MHSENLTAGTLLHHGGRLEEAIAQYGIARSDWLDISTGIAPWSWPTPSIPSECWARLPEQNSALENSAQAFYSAPHVLPVAGSQAAIQALPRLRLPCRAGVIAGSYAEYARAWHMAGHSVVPMQIDTVEQHLSTLEVLILVRPDNPSAAILPTEKILCWHKSLAQRGGWLIVDEAFMDATPEHSLAAHTRQPGLIVLRSLGKFFGLAGARIGFVCAQPDLLQSLQQLLGPWSINGPAGFVADKALQDFSWHKEQRNRLQNNSTRLALLLEQYHLIPQGHTAFFCWVPHPQASLLHEQLARQGILTRLFEHPKALRFGLPANEVAWNRLDSSLQKCLKDIQ